MPIPTFTLVPTTGQTLNITRQPIFNNFSALQQTQDINHVQIGNVGQGKHRVVEMLNQPFTIGTAGYGNLYTKPSEGSSQLFYSTDNVNFEYQLTRISVANNATFGANTAYGSPPAGFTQVGGWTFLPGGSTGGTGLLFQYGLFLKTGALGSSGTVQFPRAFTSAPFSIQLTVIRNSGNQSVTINSGSLPTTTNFSFLSSSSGSDAIYWTAIGI